MSGRVLRSSLTAVVAFFALAAIARADEPQDAPVPTIRAAAAKSFTLPARVTAQQHISILPPAAVPIAMFDTRLDARMGKGMKTTMASLYGMTAAVQLLDARFTLEAVENGHIYDMNPLMVKLLDNKPAFIATKAGLAVAAIYFTSRSVRSSPVRSIITLVGVNAVYAMLLKHNYELAKQSR